VAALWNSVVAGNSAGQSNADMDISLSLYLNKGGNQADRSSSTTSPIGIILAPLGNYGGPTQTMPPLPGSPAICAGLYSNISSGVTTDQRGDPNTNSTYPGYSVSSPCVDSGAVQTNYTLSFTIDPPQSGAAPGTAMAPAPQVTLTESGAAFTANSESISVTDANADLTTTPAMASTSGPSRRRLFLSDSL